MRTREVRSPSGPRAPAPRLAGPRLALPGPVRQILWGAPVVQREDTFPLATNDPSRGFRTQDLERLAASGGQLTFAGDLSPLSADAQKLLLDNVAETIRFALDPNHPDRAIELEALRIHFEAKGEKGPFFETPAERVDATDLYHGHVCVPKSVLESSAKLQKLRDVAAPYHGFTKGPTIGDDIRAAIGDAMPTTKPEAQRVMTAVDRHRQPFLGALAPLLQALADVPEAGVMYHSWEVDKPRIGAKRLLSDHPVRHMFTPFSTHRPEFRTLDKRDCQSLINFSFHVDRQGRITLLPGASAEMVHAFEILHDPAVPRKTAAAPTATPSAAPQDRRWSFSAAAGADLTTGEQRFAAALGGKVSLRTGEFVVFNPVIGFNLLYLPASSVNPSHLLAATADVGVRLQQPLSGFYFDVGLGGYAGFDIDPKREEPTQAAGGLTGVAGLGWRWQRLELGAETRPGARCRARPHQRADLRPGGAEVPLS